jgi:hypothetical protein
VRAARDSRPQRCAQCDTAVRVGQSYGKDLPGSIAGGRAIDPGSSPPYRRSSIASLAKRYSGGLNSRRNWSRSGPWPRPTCGQGVARSSPLLADGRREPCCSNLRSRLGGTNATVIRAPNSGLRKGMGASALARVNRAISGRPCPGTISGRGHRRARGQPGWPIWISRVKRRQIRSVGRSSNSARRLGRSVSGRCSFRSQAERKTSGRRDCLSRLRAAPRAQGGPAWIAGCSISSSRRYGTLTTTVCGRPRRVLRRRFADWL